MYRIKTINLVGELFGRLKVLSAAGKNRKNARLWLCECECGNTKEIAGWRLKNGNTQSCGCLHKEKARSQVIKEFGEAAFVGLFHRYKHEAKVKPVPFELTKEQFKVLTKGKCFYCGCEPAQIIGRKIYNGHYVYNGVDRLDSTKGYTVENCVPCCKLHNFMKHCMSFDEFIAACRSVAQHFAPHVVAQAA